MAVGLILGLYLGFPDKVYVFDGIMFSGVIERWADEWRGDLFNRRHLLFNPLFALLRGVLSWLGLESAAYPLVQKANAVLGILGLAIYWRMLSKLLRDRRLAAIASIFLAFSYSYWSRATEGQVYMLMTFGALAGAWAAQSLVASGRAQAPRPRMPSPPGAGTRLPAPGNAAARLALVFVGAVLFHAANAALAPMVALALYLAWRGPGGWRLWWVAPLIGLGIALPYAWAFELRGLRSLLDFFLKATEFYTPEGGDTWKDLLGRFFASGGLAPGSRLQLGLGNLFGALLASSLPASVQVAGGLGLGAGVAAAARLCWQDGESRGPALLFLFWGLGCAGLDIFWLGGLFFWASPLAAFLALSCLALDQRLGRWSQARQRVVLAAGGVLALGLGAWNLWAGIVPNSRLENNVGHRRSLFVRDHTVPPSWVVISGRGFANAKVYLPYFARRNREVLEYYLDRHPKAQALALFRVFVQKQVEYGIPLYLLSDLVDDEAVLGAIQKTWGVSLADIMDSFGPGRLYFIAAQDPGFKIYLFVPDGVKERLFAVLCYSVLTELTLDRLKETANALKELGREMSPAQRRRTAQVMRETNYGAQLVFDGFLPYKSEQSRKIAEERVRTFNLLQKTPDFHLRLGNFYRYLGLTAEARRAWGEAYRQTRDPALARDIANLK